MEILAVVIGYLLGITPFVVPKIVELIREKKINKEEAQEVNEQNEIFDEWLNGAKDTSESETTFNQEDVYNEYITGKVVKGD